MQRCGTSHMPQEPSPMTAIASIPSSFPDHLKTGSLSDWKGPLATFEYTFADGRTEDLSARSFALTRRDIYDFYLPDGTPEGIKRPATARGFIRPALDGEFDMPAVGDLAGAVRAANKAAIDLSSRMSNSAAEQHVAVGVLQAANGAYYTTYLGAVRDLGFYDAPGLGEGPTSPKVKVTPLTSDLKAVVGTGTWLNFTDEPIDVQLNG